LEELLDAPPVPLQAVEVAKEDKKLK